MTVDVKDWEKSPLRSRSVKHGAGAEARVLVAGAVVGEEEEGLLLAVIDFGKPHRTADGAAVLVEVDRGLGGAGQIALKGVGVEHVVLVELVEAAVESWRCRFWSPSGWCRRPGDRWTNRRRSSRRGIPGWRRAPA